MFVELVSELLVCMCVCLGASFLDTDVDVGLT